MQVLPETARQIADETGGSSFVEADLEDPKVNVRYGTYYLRTVLDQFDGDTLSAVAAYNAGGGAVGEWKAGAAAEGHSLRAGDIPFPETRAYVERRPSCSRGISEGLRRPACGGPLRLTPSRANHSWVANRCSCW